MQVPRICIYIIHAYARFHLSRSLPPSLLLHSSFSRTRDKKVKKKKMCIIPYLILNIFRGLASPIPAAPIGTIQPKSKKKSEETQIQISFFSSLNVSRRWTTNDGICTVERTDERAADDSLFGMPGTYQQMSNSINIIKAHISSSRHPHGTQFIVIFCCCCSSFYFFWRRAKCVS